MNKKQFVYSLLLFVFLLSCNKKDKGEFIPEESNPPIENEDSSNSDHVDDEDNTDSDEDLPEYVVTIQEADWESTTVSPSIGYKYFQFTNLFGARESITVLDIDMTNDNVVVDIPYVEEGSFIKTSEAGASVYATAAVNGSYFNTSVGGSHAYFRYEGSLVTQGTEDARKNAGFAISQNGEVEIIKKPTSGWNATSSYTLLVSGPLLMFDGDIIQQVSNDFNNTRHPRTAIGITEDNHILAVVVDGRFTESSGMSTTELAQTMEALGCKSAMNFDGGGSSTAWIRNIGVVNYPSDNKKWDHEGERSVATVIAFIDND